MEVTADRVRGIIRRQLTSRSTGILIQRNTFGVIMRALGGASGFSDTACGILGRRGGRVGLPCARGHMSALSGWVNSRRPMGEWPALCTRRVHLSAPEVDMGAAGDNVELTRGACTTASTAVASCN